MPPAVVIVGPPASGKSTIGRTVADRLEMDFADTDSAVATEAQMPIADIFLLQGEPEFRRLEEEASTVALETARGVLALGSGAIESPSIRERLQGRFVVQLRLDATEAATRAGITGARPVQLGGIRSQWNKSMARREAMYAKTADLIIDTGEAGIEECVAAIAAETLRRSRQNPPTIDSAGRTKFGGGSSD